MRYLLGDDGSKVFSGFKDTMRGENCVFGLASDGVQRCLPIENAPILLPHLFADSACTVAATRAACANVTYAIEPMAACGGSLKIYSIVPTSTLYSDEGGTCSQAPGAGAGFRVTGEVAATSFVGSTEKIEQ